MTSIRKIAGVLSLLCSILSIYTYFPGYAGAYYVVMLVSGVFLLVASLTCLYGIFYSFYLSAFLSGLILVFSVVAGGSMPYFVLLDMVSLASLVSSIVVLKKRSKLPEQAHPLNLPVFG
jgi:hypothetical protein